MDGWLSCDVFARLRSRSSATLFSLELEEMTTASTPFVLRLLTWSTIREISGEMTMTLFLLTTNQTQLTIEQERQQMKAIALSPGPSQHERGLGTRLI